MVALQAQEAASPYLALWNRLAPFDPAGLDAAFAGHAVIKATLMRITLHAVTAADYPPFHRAMVESLRAARLNDRRYTQTGLSAADADALIPHLVEFTAERRTNAECEALLNARLGADQPRAWWALRTFAPVVHAVTGGPWSFGYRPSYLAAPLPDQAPDGRDACVQRLAWRYLEGFGPASAADLAQFTLLTRSAARDALDAMAGRLERLEGPDGSVLFDVPGAPLPGEDTPCPPRLMAMWDSVLLAYADRGRVIPPAYRALVIRRNGDVLPTAAGRRPRRRRVAPGRRTASRRRRSTSYPNGPGRGSPTRPARWCRSWPRAIPRSTAATRTGGKNSRPPRSASCRAEIQRSWPAALRSSNSSRSTGGTRGRSA